MSKSEPTIQKYMTCQPHVIDVAATLNEAEQKMSAFGIRHLPVVNGDDVIGLISERDLKMVKGLVGAEPDKILVEDLCDGELYQVDPSTPLRVVVENMAEKHYGAAVITQNGKLVGIFTTVDACRALSSLLTQRFHL